MTIKTFIEKAIEGGWSPKGCKEIKSGAWRVQGEYMGYRGLSQDTSLHIAKILLDPLAWQAVGKVEGWIGYLHSGKEIDAEIEYHRMEVWKYNIHRFHDALCNGKDLESSLNEATS